jgi:hypothetical protein
MYHWGVVARKKMLTGMWQEGNLKNFIEMKAAVGFMLPSAGVTPAPSTNRKMARTPFCSEVLFPVSF